MDVNLSNVMQGHHALRNHPDIMKLWSETRAKLLGFLNESEDKHQAAWAMAMTLFDEMAAMRLVQMQMGGGDPQAIRNELERILSAHRRNVITLAKAYAEQNGVLNPFDANAQVRHDIMKDTGL